jgi:hypothetical protein
MATTVRVLRAVPLLLIVATLAACQSAGAVNVGSEGGAASDVSVEVDAFSGVPNPTFDLSAADASTLAGLVGSLAAARDTAAADPGLGFRGFVVTGLDLSALGSYDTLRVQGTTVVASTGSDAASAAVFTDSGNAMYALLRTAAAGAVPDNVLSVIPESGLS